MRVIAGSLKGRRLLAPSWAGLRPTSDKLRETVFNVLAPRIAGARVLDGYAGTGALGIEALSRGAASVTFVERDRRAQQLVAENLARCGIEDRYAIIRADAARAFAALQTQGESFDIVLLDPPYAEPIAALMEAGDIVAPGGVLVLEHSTKRPPPRTSGQLVGVRVIRSGDSELTFYERQR